MAILHRDALPPANRDDDSIRQRRNLADRAKRRGLTTTVQAQREWMKANPCGFEVSETVDRSHP